MNLVGRTPMEHTGYPLAGFHRMDGRGGLMRESGNFESLAV
jgi:hypothetical protein